MKKTSTLIWHALRTIDNVASLLCQCRQNKGSSPRDVVGDLPRTAVSRSAANTTSVEDSRVLRAATSGMTALFNYGFTLVELLVVVLIIGVLTAVAVPMYQNAVDKSNFSTMIPTARALKEAEEAFLLANNYYTSNEEELDVSAPGGDITYTLETKENEDPANVIRATTTKLPNVRLAQYLEDNTSYGGQMHCEALVGNERANKLCNSLSAGMKIRDENGYTLYLLNEEMDQPTCGLATRSWSTSKEKCYKTNAERCGALNMDEVSTTQCGWENENGHEVGAEGICNVTDTTDGNKCKNSIIKAGGECVASGVGSYATVNGACSGSTIENGGVCRVTGASYVACSGLTIEAGGMCIEEASAAGGTYPCGYSPSVKGTVICNGTFGCGSARNVYEEGGICVGNYGRTCLGKFTNGSICYANSNLACTTNDVGYGYATYEGTGCCCSNNSAWCPSDHTCDPTRCDPYYMDPNNFK